MSMTDPPPGTPSAPPPAEAIEPPPPGTPSAPPPAEAIEPPPPAAASMPPPPAAGGQGVAPPASPPWAPAASDRGPASGGLVIGIIFVVVGGIVLVGQVLDVTLGANAWPLWIIVPGIAMVLGSFAIPRRGGLGLAIPGAMLTMVGLVLWVQEVYDLYATWAYAWALVAPTGVGLGMLVYGLVRRDPRLAAEGLRTTLVGLALFIGFGLFFEGVVGLSGHRVEGLDEVLPYAAIGLGLLLVALSFLGGGRRQRA
jgi:hypothetical protein